MFQKLPAFLGKALDGVRAGPDKLLLNEEAAAAPETIRVESAAFELRVQLSTDIDSMPIEDASVRWDEDDSPYRTIGVIRFPAQSAWNDAKAQAWDERMGFNPANSLEAHRPLGQIMRARLFVYKRLQDWRRATNAVQKVEPVSLADLPD